MLRIRLLLSGLLLFCAQFIWAAGMVVVMDQPETALDKRIEFPEKVLQAVMERTRLEYGDYEIRHTTQAMDRKRLLYELEAGGRVNLSAKASQSEWERRLLPIRIPVDKGVNGYRIFHIRAADQERFSHVRTLDELKALRVGVQLGWSSLPIYRAHHFSMVTGNNYEGLFAMLAARRFDYLPRGLADAFIEHDVRHQQYPSLAIEQRLLLYYPFPMYFFVTPKMPELAARVQSGMQAIVADGTLDRLFYAEYADLLLRSDLCQRRLLKVSNPELSVQTPFEKAEYWFDPQRTPRSQGGCRK